MTTVGLRGRGAQEGTRPAGAPSSTRPATRARPSALSTVGLPPYRSRVRPPTYGHPVNQMVFEAAPLGARVADRVTGFMGYVA